MAKRRRLKDVNEQVLTDAGAVNRRWEEHFDELLNFEEEMEARITAVAFEQGVPRMGGSNEALVTKKDIEDSALKVIRTGKSLGMDGIAAVAQERRTAVREWLMRFVLLIFSKWCSASQLEDGNDSVHIEREG